MISFWCVCVRQKCQWIHSKKSSINLDSTCRTLYPSPAHKIQLQRVNKGKYSEIKKILPTDTIQVHPSRPPPLKPAWFNNMTLSFPWWHSSLTRLIMKRCQEDALFRVFFFFFFFCAVSSHLWLFSCLCSVQRVWNISELHFLVRCRAEFDFIIITKSMQV